MPDYRLYVVGSGGANESSENLFALDDDDAVAASSLRHSGHGRQLWCGARLVASWEAPSKVCGAITWASVVPIDYRDRNQQ